MRGGGHDGVGDPAGVRIHQSAGPASGCGRASGPSRLGRKRSPHAGHHPHRERDAAAPGIAARLEGPGWTAVFSFELPVRACHDHADWPVPTRCVGAVLPEAVRPGAAYRLHGTAPLGGFTGEMSVPAPPLLVEPEDGLRLALPDSGDVEIPVRYGIGSDIGTLLAEALDVFLTKDDGTEVGISASGLGRFPRLLEGAGADTVETFPAPGAFFPESRRHRTALQQLHRAHGHQPAPAPLAALRPGGRGGVRVFRWHDAVAGRADPDAVSRWPGFAWRTSGSGKRSRRAVDVERDVCVPRRRIGSILSEPAPSPATATG